MLVRQTVRGTVLWRTGSGLVVCNLTSATYALTLLSSLGLLLSLFLFQLLQLMLAHTGIALLDIPYQLRMRGLNKRKGVSSSPPQHTPLKSTAQFSATKKYLANGFDVFGPSCGALLFILLLHGALDAPIVSLLGRWARDKQAIKIQNM